MPSNLTEGASILFRCDEGFSPSSEMTAVCTRDMTWNPNPRNIQCCLTAEDNSPPDLVLTFGLGTLIATSVSSFIFGVLLATSVLLGVLLGIFIHKRAIEGERANENDTPPNTQSSGGANEVHPPPPPSPLISVVTSQETSNPVYEVIGDATQARATMVQLCDNIAYGHTPNGN